MNETLIPGVVIGIVKSRDDPDGEGKLLLEFPWLEDGAESAWAPVAALMAGNGTGTWFQPEVGDEVLCAFEHGQFAHPFVIGHLWNGKDRPPSEDPRERKIQTKNGQQIRFLDASRNADGNMGGIVIEDGMGNRIIMTQAKIRIESAGVLEFHAPVISFKPGGAATRIMLPTPRPI